jgi:hypothetical protein
VLMACSDYPHTEGTSTPIEDYERSASTMRPDEQAGFFHDNVAYLLRDD